MWYTTHCHERFESVHSCPWKVRDVATVMHVYPGYAKANVKAGGALLQKQLLGGRMGKIILGAGHLMLRWMRWRRRV